MRWDRLVISRLAPLMRFPKGFRRRLRNRVLCANLIVGTRSGTTLASAASIASNDTVALTTSKAACVVSEAVVQLVDAIDGIVSVDPGASNSLHGRGFRGTRCGTRH